MVSIWAGSAMSVLTATTSCPGDFVSGVQDASATKTATGDTSARRTEGADGGLPMALARR
jgi:hypothetical protein